MAAIYLPLLAQVRFEGLASGYVTDHNRRPTQVDRDEIKFSKRMADGTMRERFVSSKQKFIFSYSNLPSKAAYTVDAQWGGEDILAFYNANRVFTLKLYYSGSSVSLGTPEVTATVMWDSPPSHTINKRNANFDLWDMSFTLVEV